jgi:FKBP-type peptidyl-prolyl cis-trans isomerase
MRPARPIALALAAAALVLVGCSEETSEEAAKTDDPKADLREETSAPPETSGALKGKPRVRIPAGDPPKKLEIKDIVEGKGGTARSGSNVTVNYVGVAYSTKKEFDTSFGKPEPLRFPLGAGQVIPGFDEGIAGMKVGGRRQLTIPPDKAYGREGQPPVIGRNETLVFVVDLLAIE